ncbi:hypothetical protein DK412_06995 [Methylobacterium sp. 17Sr1-1]|jgi:hypothetical protein|nr:hypothetical protein DK412_06995 [Methylobacterium sp. 17Sr1-1]
MWTSAQITITIEEVYGNTVLVRIALPVGVLEVIGEADFRGRELRVTNAHIQGLSPGALGRAGLNSLGRKILEIYDVDVVHVAGASRTTGRNPDRPPRPFRYPRRR